MVKPDTVLHRQRDRVRRQWTVTERRTTGRTATDPPVSEVLLRLAAENPTWGDGQRQDELLKLGLEIGRSTISDRLKPEQVPPAPERATYGRNWGMVLRQYREQFLACDFLTVETAWLKTRYVFFFIELGPRRVHCAGCSSHPTAEWVTQPARQRTWTWQEEQRTMRFWIRDREAQFTTSCDAVFAAESSEMGRTP